MILSVEFGRKVRVVTNYLTEVLKLLQDSHIPDAIISQTFVQLMWYINAILFNQILHRKDICTVTNGFQVKLELSQMEGNLATFIVRFTFFEEWINQKGGPVIFKSM